MKIEIHPNILSTADIEVLMAEINPKETAVDMKYYDFTNIEFIDDKEKNHFKRVDCTEHPLVQKISNLFPYKTESVSIAYYPTNTYNTPHADNCMWENGIVKRIKDWTHTGIIFLNNNFEGGKLIYPNQGCIFVPTVGTMIVTPAGEDYIHFVEPVTVGERFTLVFRFI